MTEKNGTRRPRMNHDEETRQEKTPPLTEIIERCLARKVAIYQENAQASWDNMKLLEQALENHEVVNIEVVWPNYQSDLETPILSDEPLRPDEAQRVRESYARLSDECGPVQSFTLGPPGVKLILSVAEAENLLCALAFRIGAASAAGEGVDQLETLLDKLKAAIK